MIRSLTLAVSTLLLAGACTVQSRPGGTYAGNEPSRRPPPPPREDRQPPPDDRPPPPPNEPPPTRPDDRPHRPFRFESAGWTLLGEKTVDGRVDSDQVDFSQKQGTVSKLTIVVLDSDLEMIDLKILYVSGQDLHPTGRHYFREDSRTRVIDLPKSEILRAVIFKYKNLPGGGRARVQVWAKQP